MNRYEAEKVYKSIKKGDMLLVNTSLFDYLTEGKEYEVQEIGGVSGKCPMFKNDNGRLGSIWECDIEKGHIVKL